MWSMGNTTMASQLSKLTSLIMLRLRDSSRIDNSGDHAVMNLARLSQAAAAAMLVAAPATATTPVSVSGVNPATSLSVAPGLRASTHTSHKSDLLGIPLLFIAIGSAAVVAVVVVVATNSSST